MKHASTLLLSALIITASSCRQFQESDHLQQMTQMKDSLFKAYPSVAGITINVQDGNQLIVTLGSRKLAAADASERQQMAADIGAMTLRLFGKNSGLEKEKLIVTPNEQNAETEPADGIVSVINIDSLEQASR